MEIYLLTINDYTSLAGAINATRQRLPMREVSDWIFFNGRYDLASSLIEFFPSGLLLPADAFVDKKGRVLLMNWVLGTPSCREREREALNDRLHRRVH